MLLFTRSSSIFVRLLSRTILGGDLLLFRLAPSVLSLFFENWACIPSEDPS